jgi:hypothetical protein
MSAGRNFQDELAETFLALHIITVKSDRETLRDIALKQLRDGYSFKLAGLHRAKFGKTLDCVRIDLSQV